MNIELAIDKIEKMSKQDFINLLVESGYPDIYEIVKINDNDMRHHLKKNGNLVCVADCMIIVNHWKRQYNIDK